MTPSQPAELGAPRSKSDLFWSFHWLALQGFGGVLTVVQRELVEKKRWLTMEQFVEDWSVAQIMPGPNVVNLALMLGGRYFGLGGALASLAGLLIAPLILVLLLAALFAGIAHTQAGQGVLRGMGAVSAGLIIATGVKMLPALRNNPMGRPVSLVLLGVTLTLVAALHWPLASVLLALAPLAMAWAWHCLRGDA